MKFKQMINCFVMLCDQVSVCINFESMNNKEQQLNQMLKIQQRNELSSEEEDESRDQIASKNHYRKPIKNAFSDDDDDSDSDIEPNLVTGTPFPPKPPQQAKSILQQVQDEMKWDKTEQLETDILARLEGQGMKDKKIRELASKYKALNVAYEKEKTQRKNLENQLNSLMKSNEDFNRSSVEKKKEKSMEKSNVIKGNCSNCQENQKKCMEFRLKSQNMKSELNKAMRVLSRELGENFNIDQVLNEENAWKGRQQKIQKLKSRVRELEDKLQNNGVNVSHMSGFTQMTQNRTSTQLNTTRTSALMAENKRKELDNLKVQVEALKSENQLLQGKVKSLTSRKVILENQMKQIKGDFEKKRVILMEKSENDDKFIALLKNENEKLKKEERVVTKVIYKDDGANSDAELNKLKREVEILRRKLKAAQEVENKQSGNEPKKVTKDLNSVNSSTRVVSAEKKKQIEQEYLKGDKYLKKMTAQDEEDLYKNWKSSLNSKN